MKLSNRLEAIYNLIPETTQTVVDVGTDHGQLIIKLVLEDKIKRAYGLDIASGPLAHAKANVLAYGLSDKIKLMQMDGLENFNETVDTVVIAGMGGDTIWHIVENYNFHPNQSLIIQSNTKNVWLRKQFTNNGFKLIDEIFLIDNHKPVFIMKFSLGHQRLSELELELGPILMNQINEDYLKYLKKEYHKLKKIVSYNPDVKKRIKLIESFLKEVSYERNN